MTSLRSTLMFTEFHMHSVISLGAQFNEITEITGWNSTVWAMLMRNWEIIRTERPVDKCFLSHMDQTLQSETTACKLCGNFSGIVFWEDDHRISDSTVIWWL